MAKKLNKSFQKLKVPEESTTYNFQTCVQKKPDLVVIFCTFELTEIRAKLTASVGVKSLKASWRDPMAWAKALLGDLPV